MKFKKKMYIHKFKTFIITAIIVHLTFHEIEKLWKKEKKETFCKKEKKKLLFIGKINLPHYDSKPNA